MCITYKRLFMFFHNFITYLSSSMGSPIIHITPMSTDIGAVETFIYSWGNAITEIPREGEPWRKTKRSDR